MSARRSGAREAEARGAGSHQGQHPSARGSRAAGRAETIAFLPRGSPCVWNPKTPTSQRGKTDHRVNTVAQTPPSGQGHGGPRLLGHAGTLSVHPPEGQGPQKVRQRPRPPEPRAVREPRRNPEEVQENPLVQVDRTPGPAGGSTGERTPHLREPDPRQCTGRGSAHAAGRAAVPERRRNPMRAGAGADPPAPAADTAPPSPADTPPGPATRSPSSPAATAGDGREARQRP